MLVQIKRAERDNDDDHDIEEQNKEKQSKTKRQRYGRKGKGKMSVKHACSNQKSMMLILNGWMCIKAQQGPKRIRRNKTD